MLEQPTIETGSEHYTIVLDSQGQQVYPCRCGETHRGDYGIYTYGHHTCFHDVALMVLSQKHSTGEQVVMCPHCGATWLVEPPDPLMMGEESGSIVSVTYGLEADEEVPDEDYVG